MAGDTFFPAGTNFAPALWSLYGSMGNPNDPQSTPMYKNWLTHAKQDISAGMGASGLYDSNLGTRELASASGDMASNIWQRLYGMKLDALKLAQPSYYPTGGGGGDPAPIGNQNPYTSSPTFQYL